jgi:hypothetical protein
MDVTDRWVVLDVPQFFSIMFKIRILARKLGKNRVEWEDSKD